MNEEIDRILSEELEKINAVTEEELQSIDKIIQSEKNIEQELEYKKELIEILKKVQKLGIEIEFNEEMSIEELEDLLRGVKV